VNITIYDIVAATAVSNTGSTGGEVFLTSQYAIPIFLIWYLQQRFSHPEQNFRTLWYCRIWNWNLFS
jgi:hypothetical protein